MKKLLRLFTFSFLFMITALSWANPIVNRPWICHGTTLFNNPYVLMQVDVAPFYRHINNVGPTHGPGNAHRPDFIWEESIGGTCADQTIRWAEADTFVECRNLPMNIELVKYDQYGQPYVYQTIPCANYHEWINLGPDIKHAKCTQGGVRYAFSTTTPNFVHQKACTTGEVVSLDNKGALAWAKCDSGSISYQKINFFGQWITHTLSCSSTDVYPFENPYYLTTERLLCPPDGTVDLHFTPDPNSIPTNQSNFWEYGCTPNQVVKMNQITP